MATTATIEREALSLERIATGVEYVVETRERVDAPRTSTRTHRRLTTVIRAESGVLYVIAGDDDAVLLPGDETTVPAGISYKRWNAGDLDARYSETYRPV